MKAESFGYKNAWIAVRGAPPEMVAEALALRAVHAADWEAGIAAAYGDDMKSVFLTPAIDGWVLCAGFAFFDPASPEAEQDGYWERSDLAHPGEEHVMALAGRWSVDPSTLGERNLDVAGGLIGEFGEPRAAAPIPGTPAAKPWWKVW